MVSGRSPDTMLSTNKLPRRLPGGPQPLLHFFIGHFQRETPVGKLESRLMQDSTNLVVFGHESSSKPRSFQSFRPRRDNL